MMWKTFKSIRFWILVMMFLFSYPLLAQDGGQSLGSDSDIVYEMTGEAQIHRSNWSSTAPSQPLSVADEVDNNDVIVPVNGTNVTILCADGSLIQVTQMMQSPCHPVGNGGGQSLSDNLIDTALLNRGGVDVELLITPNGKMLSNKPLFQWTAIKNAAQYHVVVTQNGNSVWKKDYVVSAAVLKMDYPKDEAALVAGDYTVQVEALNPVGRPLSLDNVPVTQITIVPEAASKALLNSIKAPNVKSVNTSMVAYRKARVLANNGFYADAIQTMEDALKIDIPSGANLTFKSDKPYSLRTGAMPYILLGNWYTKINLPDYAGVAYRNALIVAQQFDQPENAAWANLQQAVLLTDLRQRYCGFSDGSKFFSRVLGSSTLVQQVQQQMSDAVKALGYEPTCAP